MIWSENDSCTARRADDNNMICNMKLRNVRVIKKRSWNWDMSIYRLCNAHRRMLNVYRKVYVIWVSQQSESIKESYSM